MPVVLLGCADGIRKMMERCPSRSAWEPGEGHGKDDLQML